MKIVVKVGTSTLAHCTGRLNIRVIERLCKTISDIQNAGHSIVLVSSGAIGMGMGKLGLTKKPSDMPTKQACAAIGQCELMYVYDKLFTEYNHTTAQILLTGADIEFDNRRENVTNTINRLIDLNVIPIINENDSVGTDEIEIGDNDTLSAIVSCLAKADLLVIFSDIDGLFDSDPHKNKDAKLIENVDRVDNNILALAGGAGSNLGTGGMVTKLHAAQIVNSSGIDMILTNGANVESLYDIIDGKNIGTKFHKNKGE